MVISNNEVIALVALLISMGAYLWRMGKRLGEQSATLTNHDEQLTQIHEKLEETVSTKELESLRDSINQRLGDVNENVKLVLEILMKKK
jgi:hypothetical protein